VAAKSGSGTKLHRMSRGSGSCGWPANGVAHGDRCTKSGDRRWGSSGIRMGEQEMDPLMLVRGMSALHSRPGHTRAHSSAFEMSARGSRSGGARRWRSL
jgi:hypothetical protein